MPDVLEKLIPYVVGGMLLLSGMLFVLSLWYFRRGRRDPYWRLRRAASRTGWQWFLVSLTLFFVASAGCLFSGLATLILEGEPTQQVATASPTLVTPTATVQPTMIIPSSTAVPLPSLTATMSQTPSPSPGLTPTIRPVSATATVPVASPMLSATPSATPEPIATPTLPAIVPLESAIQPRPDAFMEIEGVAGAVDADFNLQSAAGEMLAGNRRIYFAIRYSGMVDGVAWERALIRGSEIVQGGAYLWTGGEDGVAVHFFGDAGGFPAGDYEIRVFLEGRLMASAAFALK